MPARIPVAAGRDPAGKGAPSPGARSLPLVGDGQALSTLCTTAFQHDAAILRRHPHPEAVRLAPASPVGLKRALTLCHCDLCPTRFERRNVVRETPNTSRRSSEVSKARRQIRCVTVRGRLCGCVDAVPPPRPVRFLPQDFHTCGKHCGKADETAGLPLETLDLSRFQPWRRPLTPYFRASADPSIVLRRPEAGLWGESPSFPKIVRCSAWTPVSGIRSSAGSKPKSIGTASTPGSSRRLSSPKVTAPSRCGCLTSCSRTG